MNLDELMSVWRTQDEAPLHDVNKTLLHVALRQDEAKRRKWRRFERWIIYVLSAGFVAGMALCLVKPIAMYVRHRVQALREQSFGISLRDQLNRSIAQLDYQATTLHRTLMLVLVLLTGICPMVLNLALLRLNEKSISDDGYMIVWLSLLPVYAVAYGVRLLRQQTRDVVLPHKGRMEALLKELDDQE
jgi:hypothetical protein